MEDKERKPRKCKNCGHSFFGIKPVICSECGKPWEEEQELKRKEEPLDEEEEDSEGEEEDSESF